MASILTMEHVQIGFRNFAGNETQFNPEGNRNFCVFIDDSEYAKSLAAEGWNIRWTKPRNEDDDPRAYLQVKVAYNAFPPKIVMLTNHTKTPLSEQDLEVLDWSDIEYCDLVIRPYNWSMPGGRSGVSAYLKTMYAKVEDDAFDLKYANYGVQDE